MAKGQKFIESLESAVTLDVALDESSNGRRQIKAIGITADVVNGNSRVYPRPVLAVAVDELTRHLNESNGQGRLLGEIEHPSDKTGAPNLLDTVVKWTAASLSESGQVMLTGDILPTRAGQDIRVLLEAGVPLGISMRGFGAAKATLVEGNKVQEVTQLTIRGFDIVSQPSDPYATIVESIGAGDEEAQEEPKAPGETGMSDEEKRAQADAAAAQQKALDESKKREDTLNAQLAEAQKAQAELATIRQRQAVEAAVTGAMKDLKFDEAVKAGIAEAVLATNPADAQTATAAVTAQVKLVEGLLAAEELRNKGKGTGKVTDVRSNFEEGTGRKEHERASFALNESLTQAGQGHRRDLKADESPAAVFTQATLKRFDEMYKPQLMAEASMFNEAELTTDLNLPYSVARAIIEQAYPELVAPNVYDFGTTDSNPTRIYYEAYAGEAGAAPSIVDEVVAMSLVNWVQLAQKRLRPGTVVLTHTSGTPTYVEGTDYVVDYAEGKVLAIATITEAQSCKIDYTYDAFRKGEMAPIERAKNTLTYALMTVAADRLAMEISREAIIFSRSQLGYDAVTRTLGNLVRIVRRKIDKDILYMGLTASLKQANNSGGTWTSASDAVGLLVEKLGVAKAKVYNRNYTPSGILMSVTNAERLSNWDGFKRDGFPNAIMGAAGFAGSVKGLPIWQTTEFTDAWIQVVNRELVAYRVFSPMIIRGPFPSYSNGQLVSADQYYAEEFNGYMVPVEQKTAHVKVV